MTTIRVISCGKAKRPGIHPAKDLYIGGFFKACRAWAEESPDGWVIFSAKHGLILPDEMIECYDVFKLTPNWKERVIARMDPKAHYVSVAGDKYMAQFLDRPDWIENVFPMGQGWFMGKKIQWLKAHTQSQRGLFS